MKTFHPSRRSKQQKAEAIHFSWLRFPPDIPEDSQKMLTVTNRINLPYNAGPPLSAQAPPLVCTGYLKGLGHAILGNFVNYEL